MLTLLPIALSAMAVEAPASDLPASQFLQLPNAPEGQLSVSVELPGRTANIVLFPDDSRSEELRVFRQVPGGLFPIPAPQPRTLTGYLQGEANSLVSATLEDGKLTALVHDLESRSTWIVEPRNPYAPRMHSRVEHRVRPFLGSELSCGCDLEEAGQGNAGIGSLEPGDERVGRTPQVPAFSSTGLLSMDIILDSTAELYAAFGGDEPALSSYLLSLAHHSSVLFEAQLGLKLEVTQLVLRPDSQAAGYPYEPDFQYSGSNTSALHNDIRQEWGFGWHPVYSHDYVHLFSDRGLNVSASGVIGGSQSDDICNTVTQFGMAIERPTSWGRVEGAAGFDSDVEVLTHEIGHGFDIVHTSGLEGSSGLMAPAINGEFFFSAHDLNLAETRINTQGSCYETATPNAAPLVVQSYAPTSVEILGTTPVVVQGSGLDTVYSIEFGSDVLDFSDFSIDSANQITIHNFDALDAGIHVGTLNSLGGTGSITIEVLPIAEPLLEVLDFAGVSLSLRTWGEPGGFNLNFMSFHPDTFDLLGSDVLLLREELNGVYLATDGQGYTNETWMYLGAGLGGTTVWLQGATYDASLVYQGVTNIESIVLGSL